MCLFENESRILFWIQRDYWDIPDVSFPTLRQANTHHYWFSLPSLRPVGFAMHVPLFKRAVDRATTQIQRDCESLLAYPGDPGCSSLSRALTTAASVLSRYDSLNDAPSGQSKPISQVRSHIYGRDWEERHQGSNFGWIFGGILGLVGLTLAGGYALARWKRLWLLKRRVTNASELPSNNSHRSVDLAPLLPNAENWRPALSRISEHNEEPSDSIVRSQGRRDHPALSTHPPWSSGEENDRLLAVASSQFPTPLNKGEVLNDDPALSSDAIAYEHWRPRVREAPLKTSSPRNISIPQGPTPASPEDVMVSRDMAPLQTSGRYPFSRELDSETPNVSASDSDSMQVNIPWRDSSRFMPPRTQSLPMDQSHSESSPSFTPGDRTIHTFESPPALSAKGEPTSFSQPSVDVPSVLQLRALKEEEDEASEVPSKSLSLLSPIRQSSLENDRSPTEARSSQGSSLSSLSKLRFRMTGSAPFLPLIEESSPLDTDRLFSRLKGPSRRSSMSSKKSRLSQPRPIPPPSPPFEPTKPPSSALESTESPPLSVALTQPSHPPTRGLPRPPTPPSFSSSPSSPSPSPSAFPLPPTSPNSFVPETKSAPEPFALTPVMNGATTLPSAGSHSRVPSSRSYSSPLPASSIGGSANPSASSVAQLPSPYQQLESPAVLQPLTAPRRLPVRPLPGLPSQLDKPSSPPRVLSVISDESQRNSSSQASRIPWVNSTPIPSTEETTGRFA